MPKQIQSAVLPETINTNIFFMKEKGDFLGTFYFKALNIYMKQFFSFRYLL